MINGSYPDSKYSHLHNPAEQGIRLLVIGVGNVVDA
jgi:hypothetical protein